MSQSLPPFVSPLPGATPMRPVGRVVQALADRWQLVGDDTMSRLADGWTSLVGCEIAAHSRPTSIRCGRLSVEADDPAVVEYLRWSSTDLVNALRRHLDIDDVEEFHVVLNRR